MGLADGSPKSKADYALLDTPNGFRKSHCCRRRNLAFALVTLLVLTAFGAHFGIHLTGSTVGSLLTEFKPSERANDSRTNAGLRPQILVEFKPLVASNETNSDGNDLYKKFKRFFHDNETATFVQEYGGSCNDNQFLFTWVFDDYWAKPGYASCVNNAISNFVLDFQPELRSKHRFAFLDNNWRYAPLTDFFKDFGRTLNCPIFLDINEITKSRRGKNIDFVKHNVSLAFSKSTGVTINQTEDVIMQFDSAAWKTMRAVFAQLAASDGVPVIFKKKSLVAKALWQPHDGLFDIIFLFWQRLVRGSGQYIAVHIRRGDKIIGLEMKDIPTLSYVKKAKDVCKRMSGQNETCNHRIFIMCDEDASFKAFQNLSNDAYEVVNLKTLAEELELPVKEYFVPSIDSVRKTSANDKQFWTIMTRQLIVETTLLAMADQVICTMSSNLCRLAALIKGSYDGDVHSLDVPWHAL